MISKSKFTKNENLRFGMEAAKDLPWGFGKKVEQHNDVVSRHVLDDDLGVFTDRGL